MLVAKDVVAAGGAHLRAAARDANLGRLALQGQVVTGVDGFQPAYVVDAGRAQGLYAARLHFIDHEPHRVAAGLPAADRELLEERVRGGGLVVQVEGLRIVFPGEVQRFLAGDVYGAEHAGVALSHVVQVDHGSLRFDVRWTVAR